MLRPNLPTYQQPTLTYPARLQSFQGYWDDNEATARQLAAIGHVYDRPPLEAIEEGSRCISCTQFVKREYSVSALEGTVGARQDSYEDRFEGFQFHHARCEYLQVRIPLEPQATLAGLHGGVKVSDRKDLWERLSRKPVTVPVTPRPEQDQSSSLFSLPTELRLQIYAMVLPQLDECMEIVTLNKDTARVVTQVGHSKTGRLDLTKTNILRACKAVHNEALDILYTNHTYRFANSKTLYLFLRQIGHHGGALLKSVDIYCGSREDAITFALLACCSKLRTVTIRLPRPKLMPPWASLWRVDGVATLLALRGLEVVKIADCGLVIKDCLRDSSADAEVLRRELMRSRGQESGVRWVCGHLDL